MRLPRNTKMLRGPLDASAIAGTLFLFWAATLLHSSLVLPPGVHLRLPEAPGLLGEALPGITVAVDPAGRVLLDNQVILDRELETRLRARAARRGTNETLLLLADSRVTAQSLAKLINLARQVGIRDVILATSPGPTPGPSGEAR